MIQKKNGIAAGKQYFWGLAAVIGIIFALWCQSFVSLADSIGTVTASSATIRKDTNTNSTALGSVASGTTVSITDEVQDSAGMLWYQVSVNGQTGYIRSDLVSKTDAGTGSGGDGSQTPSGATVEPDTVQDAQYATVSAGTIKVRTAPSTNEGVVENLNRNAQVIVGGESQGSDGMKWYYVTFTGTGGALRSGFIRSDLLLLGEMVPVPEEEVPEPQEIEPEPEVVVNIDYELRYDPNADESGAWILVDNTDPQHLGYPVKKLMEATQVRDRNDAADAKALVRQRIAIVALIILVVLLIAVIVIMALKLRDVYYEDYEDEDEEEEETPTPRRRRMQEDEEADTRRRRRTQEDEETPIRRRRRMQEAEETPTQRRRRTEETEEAPARRRRRMEDSERETERPVRRRPTRDERGNDVREVEYREDEAGSAPVKTALKRKAKNFLLDDDEFEFEFLNMEDKD